MKKTSLTAIRPADEWEKDGKNRTGTCIQFPRLLSFNDNSRGNWMLMSRQFGQVLKELRLRAGFGLRRFAEMVDLEPSNLSAIEHGRRVPPQEPARLREIADSLGLVEGSPDWVEFFDSARSNQGLPADVLHLADRPLVPMLLRTIDNRNLSDDEIARLIKEIQNRPGEKPGGSA